MHIGRAKNCSFARNVVVLFFTLALVVGFVSCHKDNTVKRHKDFHSERTEKRRDKSRDHDKNEDAWKTLNIKLSRKDNKALYAELRSWLGTPYKYAASEKRKGTDCSGMVMEVYREVYHIRLERNSAMMFEKNCKKIDRDDLREGDLVFFITGKSGRISHVGIYLKEGKFVHASSSRGVIVSDLSENYWSKHYTVSGRVKDND